MFVGKGGTIVGEGGTKEREEIARGDRLQRQDATPHKVGRLAGSGKIFPQGDGAALEPLA